MNLALSLRRQAEVAPGWRRIAMMGIWPSGF
jgi:hypothetical protein